MTDESSYYEEEDAGPGLPAQLRDPIRVLRRQLPLMFTSLVLFLIATAAVTMLFPLKYEARATILLTGKSIPDEFVPTTVIANILEEFEAIRGLVFSRTSLSTIISETGLYPKERDSVPLEGLAVRLGTELTVEPIMTSSRSRDTPHSMAFEVKMAGDDPELVAVVVNTAVADLINANIEYRSRQARITTEFMKREYDAADAELRIHQRYLAEFRADHMGALPEEQGAAISKLERLVDERGNSILLITELQARLERVDARPEALLEDGTLEALRSRLNNARAIYTDDHPTIHSLTRQVAEREKLEGTDGSPRSAAAMEERAEIAKSIELEQMRLDTIDKTVRDLEGLLATTPTISEEYAALVRKEIILQENYVEYLRKLKNAELALSLEQSQQGAQLTRLDSALPPSSPILERWMVAFAGFVLSFGLALAVGIARELLNPVLIDEQHLEESIRIPCLGSITELA